METREWVLKLSRAGYLYEGGGQLENGAVLKGSAEETRTLHSWDESIGSKGLTHPKTPAARATSALEMSPVSK